MKDKLQMLAYNIGAVLIGLVISGCMLLFMKVDPLAVCAEALGKIFSDRYTLGEILVKASPLIFTSLAFAFTYKANLFNIGAQGQFYAGSIAAITVSLAIGGHAPTPVVLLCSFACAFAAGALIGGLIGLAKARFGANEFLVSMMSTYVVQALMDYLPPQSISTTVSQFKKDAKNRIATLGKTNLSASVAASYGLISDDADKITDAQDDLRRVESQLATSVDVAAEVRKLQNEIFVCKKSASDQVRRIADLTSEQDRLTRERDTADTNRRELSLKDDKNRMIEICRSYALEIYNQLSEVYKKSETEVRTKLQATINEIFNDIYDGGLSLSIDEKYHITVTVNGYGEDNVETSTAQSISVIFAFIAGIIKMARENKNTTSEELRMLESEPYPLVMDAPLSAFDKKRIASVCKALPDVAEQVIIFIKDTDGDLAEKYMSDKIGSRHRFDKVDEFETHLA